MPSGWPQVYSSSGIPWPVRQRLDLRPGLFDCGVIQSSLKQDPPPSSFHYIPVIMVLHRLAHDLPQRSGSLGEGDTGGGTIDGFVRTAVHQHPLGDRWTGISSHVKKAFAFVIEKKIFSQASPPNAYPFHP